MQAGLGPKLADARQKTLMDHQRPIEQLKLYFREKQIKVGISPDNACLTKYDQWRAVVRYAEGKSMALTSWWIWLKTNTLMLAEFLQYIWFFV